MLKRLLYVEDDDNIAEVVLMALEDIGGFQVRRCASGREALDCVAAFRPQLIVMDVMMPGMDGPETLRHMRALPEVANVPVVFMTAKAQLHEQEVYHAMGAAGVIVKPFDPVTLSDEVRDLWAAAMRDDGLARDEIEAGRAER